MSAQHPRERITEIQCVVPLKGVGNRNAHHKGRERDIFHALELRSLDDDTLRPRAGHKALRLKRHSQAAVRLANIVHISQEPDVKFIDRRWAEDLCIADCDFLGLPDRQSVKARDARAALPAGIRIVQPVVVNEIVTGDLAQSRICIHAGASFVIPHGLGIGGSRKQIGADVRRRNILQQMLGGRGPCRLRNNCARKNALRTGIAAGRVVRFTLGNSITKLAREQISEVRAAHFSRQRTFGVAEVAGTFLI